jgi:hypothetical protein
MPPIDQLLLIYDDLPPAERSEADAYLIDHPDARKTVEEGRRLRALARRPRSGEPGVTDAELLYLLSAPPGRPLPPLLAAVADRVEAARAASPEVAARHEELAHQIQEFEASIPSARAQFEALTGRSLRQRDGVRQDRPAVAPARHRWRQPAPWSPAKLAIAATILLAVAYGVLFMVSEASLSETERLAALGGVPSDYAVVQLRGEASQADRVTGNYVAALEELRQARSTTLGLFPRYDADGLDRALERFGAVVEADVPDGAFGLEARFLRARILLYRGEVAAAREELRLVIDRQGPSAPDAARLLETMTDRGLLD